jgi:hypothetical protein
MALPDQDPAMSLNPVLACMLPIVLSVHPRENPAVEALRLSLLGLGAIHKVSVKNYLSPFLRINDLPPPNLNPPCRRLCGGQLYPKWKELPYL